MFLEVRALDPGVYRLFGFRGSFEVEVCSSLSDWLVMLPFAWESVCTLIARAERFSVECFLRRVPRGPRAGPRRLSSFLFSWLVLSRSVL